RNFARRWNNGASAGDDGVPQKTQSSHLHDPKSDRLSTKARKTGRARASDKIADRLRRFRFAFVSRDTRRDAPSRAGERQGRQEQTGAGARSQRMSDRRRVWITPVRLRESIARG